MRVQVLMSTDGYREFVEVEGSPTGIPNLALTPYKHGYSVTHIPTGRAVNDKPLSRDQAVLLVEDLEKMDIPWSRVVDGDNSKLLRFSRR
jgi:hypothetical protein